MSEPAPLIYDEIIINDGKYFAMIDNIKYKLTYLGSGNEGIIFEHPLIKGKIIKLFPALCDKSDTNRNREFNRMLSATYSIDQQEAQGYNIYIPEGPIILKTTQKGQPQIIGYYRIDCPQSDETLETLYNNRDILFLPYALQAIEAINFLNNHGIVFGDLTLKNYKICDGKVIVNDFGQTTYYCDKDQYGQKEWYFKINLYRFYKSIFEVLKSYTKCAEPYTCFTGVDIFISILEFQEEINIHDLRAFIEKIISQLPDEDRYRAEQLCER